MPRPCIVEWRHFRNCLGPGGAQRLHPVVRRDGGAWERLAAGKLVEADNGCPTAVWELEAPRQCLEAAFCFPPGPPEVAGLVASLSL